MFIIVIFCVILIGIVFMGTFFAIIAAEDRKAKEERNLREAEALRKENEEFDRLHPHYAAEHFYKKCKEAGIEDADSKESIARLKLFAQRQSIFESESVLIEKFNLGKSEVDRIKKLERIAELEVQEAALEEESKKYVHLKGNKKCIAMYKDKAKPHRDEIEKLDEAYSAIMNGQFAIYSDLKGHESDWAVHGGIASAIGGMGAGVATAMDVQRKNAEVKVNNAVLLNKINSAYAPARDEILRQKGEHVKAAEKFEKYADNAQNLLTEYLPENELKKMLKVRTSKISRSDTGAVIITGTIQETKELKIYDTVDAVVDGSLRVVLYSNDEYAGEAVFSLPAVGAAKNHRFEAICRKPIIESEKYRASYEPLNLFAIERQKG